MADRDLNSHGATFASELTQTSSRMLSLNRIFKTCESPACKKRQAYWSLWSRKSEGIRLQGRWYCGPECFEHATQNELLRLRPAPETSRKKTHRIPIGLLLLSRGMINDAQLKQALTLQREKGTGKIGKFLQDMRAVTEKDITMGLAAQWGCPVYPLDGTQDLLQYASLLPLTLLEAGRMLPVHHILVQQTLYLGFVEGIDRSALYAVEQMLHLRTIPCIVSESAHRGAIEELRHAEDLQTTIFDAPFEPREIARTTRSYAWQLGAKDVRMVRSGQFIWVRLQNLHGPKDILFQAVTGV